MRLMKRLRWVVVGLGVAVCAAPSVGAGVNGDIKKQIVDDLMSRRFVAKTDLFEAQVFEIGGISSNRDRESIKPGYPINIKKIEFSGDRILIALKHPHVKESTYVEFLFTEKLSKDFSRERGIFAEMLASVFEPAP